MPPKVDKAAQKQKEKVAVDKTFGLKNKNKSKVVQKYIKNITQNVVAGGAKKEADKMKEKDDKAKAVQKAALLNSLFNMATDKKGRAFDPAAKKAAKQAEEEAIAAGKKLDTEVRKAIIEGIANSIRLTNPKGVRMSELGGTPIVNSLKDNYADAFKTLSLLLFIKANKETFWVDDPDTSNPTIRVQEDVDAEVAPDERPIEEIIEEKRAALPPGGTPVTKESFKAWKEKKEAERQSQVEEERQALAKKSGGKGLAALSGRDLFTFDATLFDVDDEGAASDYDEREASDEEEPGALLPPPRRADLDEEDEGEAAGSGDEGDAGARGSGEPADGGPIDAALFLEGGELPDDLDDLDEDEDECEGGALAEEARKDEGAPAEEARKDSFAPPPRR